MIPIMTLAPERWREYRALRLEALKSHPQAFCATYESQAAKPDEWWRERLIDVQSQGSWLLFAEDQGALTGMVGAAWAGEAIDIISMFVRDSHRGKGVGRLLMQAILEATEDARPARHVLSVNSEQREAVALYKAFRFEITREAEYVFGDGRASKAYDMVREV